MCNITIYEMCGIHSVSIPQKNLDIYSSMFRNVLFWSGNIQHNVEFRIIL